MTGKGYSEGEVRRLILLYLFVGFVIGAFFLLLTMSFAMEVEEKYENWKEGSLLDQFEFCHITRKQADLVLQYMNHDLNLTKWVEEMNETLLEERRNEVMELYNDSIEQFNQSFRNDKLWRENYARIKGLKRS